MQKGSKFLKNSVMQMGPVIKAQIHVESRSQSSTPPPPRGLNIVSKMWGSHHTIGILLHSLILLEPLLDL